MYTTLCLFFFHLEYTISHRRLATTQSFTEALPYCHKRVAREAPVSYASAALDLQFKWHPGIRRRDHKCMSLMKQSRQIGHVFRRQYIFIMFPRRTGCVYEWQTSPCMWVLLILTSLWHVIGSVSASRLRQISGCRACLLILWMWERYPRLQSGKT